MSAATFPGGTSVTLLDVYDDPAPDGVCGGSPHMHLASTEAYVVIAGEGALHNVDASGVHETDLREGSVVWFTPGTIHRAVNHGDLRVVVLMSNAGLPEAGDAVLTFPPEVLADPERYAAAALLPAGSPETVAGAAARRRDLAVEGFLQIRDSVRAGDVQPLHDFYAAASRLIQGRAGSWIDVVERGPAAQAAQTLDTVRALVAGDAGHLAQSAVSEGMPLGGEPRFGMCGRLRTFDVSGGSGQRSHG